MTKKGGVDTDIPLGNGKSEVIVGREFKEWKGFNDGGFTVGANVSVKLTCDQSKDAIEKAILTAGDIAEEFALGAIEDMQEGYLKGAK